MTFPEAASRLQAAVFGRLGEDAQWTGIAGTVRVRRTERDDEVRLDMGWTIDTVRFVKVRRSEVAAPAEDEQVQILDAAGATVAGALYRVSGAPRLDRKGVWTCPVEPVA